MREVEREETTTIAIAIRRQLPIATASAKQKPPPGLLLDGGFVVFGRKIDSLCPLERTAIIVAVTVGDSSQRPAGLREEGTSRVHGYNIRCRCGGEDSPRRSRRGTTVGMVVRGFLCNSVAPYFPLFPRKGRHCAHPTLGQAVRPLLRVAVRLHALAWMW
jgi:hypothetical protein